ncbi:MAG: redox-regulated ATPase YchF, partial [Candidatus Altiarchaeota archaeon]|nr:redox-regulated ATPase YchF [Candidatus Altiarchaeota archaeon]
FKAATLKDVEVADYPFTTVKPNVGIAHVRTKCPVDVCNPRRGACINRSRFVPVEIYDVAGLVPGAHQGKGLGNQFLDDARRSRVLIMVVDATGRTDKEGNEGEGNPVEDVKFVLEEFDRWLAGIIKNQMKKTGSVEENLLGITGLGIPKYIIKKTLLSSHPTGDCLEFSTKLRQASKPVIIAANKSDFSDKWLDKLKQLGYPVIATSATFELALRKASEAGIIEYIPGDGEFKVIKEVSKEQKAALDRISAFLMRFGSTGIQELLNHGTFKLAKMITVFPVEDENKWTDSKGNKLPDCLLIDDGSTAKDLAYKVHSDIGDGFIKAIDAKTKRTIGASHELKDGDIIRIMSR